MEWVKDNQEGILRIIFMIITTSFLILIVNSL